MELTDEQGLEQVQKTFKKLQEAVSKAEKNDIALLECFVLAQLLDNQLQFFKDYLDLGLDLKINNQLAELEKRREEEYSKLYRVYDRLSTKEIVEMIYIKLGEAVEEYRKKMDYMGEVSEQELLEVLYLRDMIKILFDELEVWTNRFTKKERQELESQDKIFKEIKEIDNKLREELIINSQLHEALHRAAEFEMVRRPDGSKRYDYWWWYAGK